MDLRSLDGVRSPEPVWEADVTCRRVEENIAYEEYPAVVGPVRLDTGRRTEHFSVPEWRLVRLSEEQACNPRRPLHSRSDRKRRYQLQRIAGCRIPQRRPGPR